MKAFHPRLALWVTTLIWTVTIGVMWGYQHALRAQGTEIELKVIPVDPRDFLRGEYVALRYDISTVKVQKRPDGKPLFKKSQIVYAALQKVGDTYQVASLNSRRPAKGLYLQGRIQHASPDEFTLEYGIESFFLPEGEAKEYEQAQRAKHLHAVVNVGSGGVTKLKRLVVKS